MPRKCPHCKVQIPLDRGFHFDEAMNLVCDKCDKIAFPSGSTPHTIYVKPELRPPVQDLSKQGWSNQWPNDQGLKQQTPFCEQYAGSDLDQE